MTPLELNTLNLRAAEVCGIPVVSIAKNEPKEWVTTPYPRVEDLDGWTRYKTDKIDPGHSWNPAEDLNQAFEVWRHVYRRVNEMFATAETQLLIRKRVRGIRSQLRDAWDLAKLADTPQAAALALTTAAISAFDALKEGV